MLKMMLRVLAAVLAMQGIAVAQQPLLTAIGNIYPSAQCKLGSQVSGRVDEVYVEVGDSVRKGRPLAKLDPIQFEIDVAQKQAVLDSAQIELADTEKNYLRMKNLWEKPEGGTPSISQKRFEEAKLVYEKGKVQVILAQENLNRAIVNLNETLIKASFDGIVTKRYVDPGEAITSIPVTHLIEIQSINPLYLEFSVSQAFLSSIKPGTPIVFEVEGAKKARYEGHIDRIYPVVDETTRSTKCRAIIDNANKELRPGALAKVEIYQP